MPEIKNRDSFLEEALENQLSDYGANNGFSALASSLSLQTTNKLKKNGMFFRLFPWMREGGDVKYNARYHESQLVRDLLAEEVGSVVRELIERAIAPGIADPDVADVRAALIILLSSPEGSKKYASGNMPPGFGDEWMPKIFLDKLSYDLTTVVTNLVHPGLGGFDFEKERGC